MSLLIISKNATVMRNILIYINLVTLLVIVIKLMLYLIIYLLIIIIILSLVDAYCRCKMYYENYSLFFFFPIDYIFLAVSPTNYDNFTINLYSRLTFYTFFFTTNKIMQNKQRWRLLNMKTNSSSLLY